VELFNFSRGLRVSGPREPIILARRAAEKNHREPRRAEAIRNTIAVDWDIYARQPMVGRSISHGAGEWESERMGDDLL